MITIGILVLDEVIADYPDVVDNEIVNLLKVARECLDDSPEFTSAWEKFCEQVDGLELKEKIQMTIEKRKDNKTLQFLMGFVRLVKRLFTFIEAVRSRDWDLYLSSFEAMIKDFSSLDRIKYRRWSAVYLADMHHLKESDDEEDQKVWQAFKNGDFSCQKSTIPGTAIGRDHCGEQENKKIKIEEV